jgi:hypothetical protein
MAVATVSLGIPVGGWSSSACGEVIPLNPRARLVLVDGLTDRRTARDPDVIHLVADFVASDETRTATTRM